MSDAIICTNTTYDFVGVPLAFTPTDVGVLTSNSYQGLYAKSFLTVEELTTKILLDIPTTPVDVILNALYHPDCKGGWVIDSRVKGYNIFLSTYISILVRNNTVVSYVYDETRSLFIVIQEDNDVIMLMDQLYVDNVTGVEMVSGF